MTCSRTEQEKLLEAIVSLRSDLAAAAAERKHLQLDAISSSTVVAAAGRVRSRVSAVQPVPRHITAAAVASSSSAARLVPVPPPVLHEKSNGGCGSERGYALPQPGLKARSSLGGGQQQIVASAGLQPAAAPTMKTPAAIMEDWPDSSQLMNTLRRFRSETVSSPSPSSTNTTSTAVTAGATGCLRNPHRADPPSRSVDLKILPSASAGTTPAGGPSQSKPRPPSTGNAVPLSISAKEGVEEVLQTRQTLRVLAGLQPSSSR